MSKQTKTTIVAIGGIAITVAVVSAFKLIKLVKDLNEIKIDLNLCDGDLCPLCSEEKTCMASGDEKE